MKEKEFLNHRCHDCNAREGQLHIWGCDMEICPFCGGQLITCSCCYTLVGLDYDENKPFSGLPKEIYNKGLTKELKIKWIDILIAKGRIPYIILPNFCRRCLKPYPAMFSVPNEEWNNLPLGLRKKTLCKDCYDKIKKWRKTNERRTNKKK